MVGPNGSGKSAFLQYLATQSGGVIKRIAAHRQTWFESGGIDMTPASRLDFESNRSRYERHATSRWRDDNGRQSLSAVLFDLVAKENTRARAIAEHADRSDGDGAVSEAERSESPFAALNNLLKLGLITVCLHNSNDTEITARHGGGAELSAP